MVKENKAHEEKKDQRLNLGIKDGADELLKQFRIPSKGTYEPPKLFE